MPIVPQHAEATADGDGDAVLVFPQAPSGQSYCGTAAVPGAPAGAVGTVTAGGELLGSSFGPGFFGPWTATPPLALTISLTGLVPGEQYQGVWHADTERQAWPEAITAAFVGTVEIPLPVEVSGTVTADQGDPPWAVDGTVTADQGTPGADAWPVVEPLASAAPGGSTAMTGSPVALPSHGATRGVFLLAPSANAAPVTVNGATLDPGDSTGLLPVDNSDVFTATGTSGDVLSFLVT